MKSKGAGTDPGRDFLVVGSMGHASQIALGIALARPQLRVYCLDGDGAVLMHMGGLAIIGTRGPTNFRHVVLNNGVHDSVGGQPTVGLDVDFSAIAAACGYPFSEAEGPGFLEIRVRPGARAELGRPKAAPAESRAAFMTWLDS